MRDHAVHRSGRDIKPPPCDRSVPADTLSQTMLRTSSAQVAPLPERRELIPPTAADGISIGDLSEASAIESAALVLNVANIVAAPVMNKNGFTCLNSLERQVIVTAVAIRGPIHVR